MREIGAPSGREVFTRRELILLGAGWLAVGLTGCSNSEHEEPRSEETESSDSPPTGAMVIRDVRIFDGERLSDADTVIVEGGMIMAVGKDLEPPSGADVHDGRGGALVPGLIDCHGHTRDDSDLEDSLRFGVTTVLDMFTGRLELMRELQSQRRGLGPTDLADFWSSGTLVTAPGGHPTQAGWPIPTLAPGDDAGQFVDDRVAEGSDYIKIVIDDGSHVGHDRPTLTADQVYAVVGAAHERDLLTVVHAATWEDAATAAAAGTDLLAHVPIDALVDEQLLNEITDAGTAVVATLAVMAAPACTDYGPNLLDDATVAPYLSEAQSRGLGFDSPTCFHGVLSTSMDNVRALREAGVPILAGTDYPNNGVVPGASLLLELELMERAGLRPTDILAGATSLPASRFGLRDRGWIAPDMRADFVLVEGDPTTDILAVRNITRIWKNGYPVDRG